MTLEVAGPPKKCSYFLWTLSLISTLPPSSPPLPTPPDSFSVPNNSLFGIPSTGLYFHIPLFICVYIGIIILILSPPHNHLLVNKKPKKTQKKTKKKTKKTQKHYSLTKHQIHLFLKVSNPSKMNCLSFPVFNSAVSNYSSNAAAG